MAKDIKLITSCDGTTSNTQVLYNNFALLRQQDMSARLDEIRELEDLLAIKKRILSEEIRADLQEEQSIINSYHTETVKPKAPWIADLYNIKANIEALYKAISEGVLMHNSPDVINQYKTITEAIMAVDADIREHEYLWLWEDIYDEYSGATTVVMQSLQQLQNLIAGGVA